MIEILCKSDYQDVYRIKDGVLLVVNKFKYKIDENGWRISCYYSDAKRKKYCKGCKSLMILTEDYYILRNDFVLKAGTVFYNGCVVELAPKEEWNYQIKTTGDLFSGTSEEVLKYIEEIINIIKEV